VIWGGEGAFLCFEGAKGMLSAPGITKPKLEVLASYGLIYSHVEYETDISEFAGRETHVQRERTRVISVTQKGYEFVDNPSKRSLSDNSRPGSVTITNFQGIFGNIEGGNVTQTFNLNVEKGKFESLAAFLRDKQLGEADIASLKQAIEGDPPAPKDGTLGEHTATWIADLTKKSLMGTWKLGRDVGVAVIAQAISQYYGFSP